MCAAAPGEGASESAAYKTQQTASKNQQWTKDGDSSSTKNTTIQLLEELPIFRHCEIYSVDENCQKSVCTHLKLKHFSYESHMAELLPAAATQLSAYIY